MAIIVDASAAVRGGVMIHRSIADRQGRSIFIAVVVDSAPKSSLVVADDAMIER